MKKNVSKILPITVVLIGVIIFCSLIIVKTTEREKSEYLYSEYISSSQNIETGNIKISTVKVQKDVDVEIVDIEYPYLNDNLDVVARDINTQIYKFVFFTRGGHYVLENDGYVTDIETRYGIPYVGDTLISIFFETYGQEFGNYSEGCAGLNFNLESGKLLALSDFYEVAELKKILEDGMKAGTVTIISDLPLHEYEKEEYFQTFLDDLGTYYETDDGLTGYMNYADNFFFTEDSICLIGEPYPSTVEAMFIKMKIDKIPTIKSDI